MLHWYCKATNNLGQFFSPKATYNLGWREYYINNHCLSFIQYGERIPFNSFVDFVFLGSGSWL